MSPRRALVFLALLLFSAFAATGQEGPLRIVGGESYAPFAYTGEDGSPKGILIDFWTLWSQKTGRAVTFELLPWSEVPTALERNQGDVICGLFASQARARPMGSGRPSQLGAPSAFMVTSAAG